MNNPNPVGSGLAHVSRHHTGGGCGIRTPGGLHLNGFRGRRPGSLLEPENSGSPSPGKGLPLSRSYLLLPAKPRSTPLPVVPQWYDSNSGRAERRRPRRRSDRRSGAVSCAERGNDMCVEAHSKTHHVASVSMMAKQADPPCCSVRQRVVGRTPTASWATRQRSSCLGAASRQCRPRGGGRDVALLCDGVRGVVVAYRLILMGWVCGTLSGGLWRLWMVVLTLSHALAWPLWWGRRPMAALSPSPAAAGPAVGPTPRVAIR